MVNVRTNLEYFIVLARTNIAHFASFIPSVLFGVDLHACLKGRVQTSPSQLTSTSTLVPNKHRLPTQNMEPTNYRGRTRTLSQ
jgi:hypothetical protein